MTRPRRSSGSGRPRQHRADTVAVTIRIPPEVYDAYCRVSIAEEVPLTRLFVCAIRETDPQRLIAFCRQ